MKKLRKFQWIIVGCTSIGLVTASVFLYLHLSSKANDQDNKSSTLSTNASNALTIEQTSQTSLVHRTPAEALVELVKIESNFQRTASLYAYLAEVKESELVNLLHHTESIKRASIRSNIQTIILRKVATVDPVQALDWITDVPKVRRVPLLKGLFHDWSITNLTQAIEGAKSLIGTDRRVALEAMLATREDLSSSTLLDIAQELGLEEFALLQISANQAHKLLDNPSAAWDVIVNDNVEDTKQLDLFQLVASAWKEDEGLDVLLRAAAAFPHENDHLALSKVIEDVVGGELKEAFDYVRNLSKEDRGQLPAALAMVAARVNPEVALSEIASWSDDPIHTHLERIASTTWAESDPRGMLNKLELVPQFTRAEALEIAFTHLAYVSPQEAIQNLERANKFLSTKTLLPSIIAEQWSQADPEAALEWSISYAGSNTELRKSLIRSLFRSVVANDIEKALELSSEIRSTYIRFFSEAKYDIVEKLAQMGRLEDAISRLPMLDKNESHFAIKDLGWRLVEAGEPYAAIELGANIPTPDPSMIITGPASYFNGVFNLWATRDPQQLFDSLQTLTSPLLRSMAARTLINRQKSRPTLAEESIEEAEKLLSEYPITENMHLLELQLQDEKGLIDLDQMVLPSDWVE
ncbi:MAG: hypothetical protein F4W92_08360 [Gammaproteobacteria bacterium]|nr:hypothetical protein [Gammaproteobacteria bacterium]